MHIQNRTKLWDIGIIDSFVHALMQYSLLADGSTSKK